MVAEKAREDIEELHRRGLAPTVDDIVTLNELALRCRADYSTDDIYAAPRIAWLDRTPIFEPTLQAEAWLDLADRWWPEAAPARRDIVMAFAYAHGLERAGWFDRPLLRLPATASLAVTYWYRRRLARVTPAQVYDAVQYAVYGTDPGADVSPVSKRDDAPKPNHFTSYARGLADEAIALGLGVTVAELDRMNVGALRGIVRRAYELRGLVGTRKDISLARGAEYMNTLAKITARLEEEARVAAQVPAAGKVKA